MKSQADTHRKGTNTTGSEGAWHSIFLVASQYFSIVAHKTSLQEFESAEINGRIRKHADETHCQATIRCAPGPLCIHLLGGLDDELVARGTSSNGFTLHAEEC